MDSELIRIDFVNYLKEKNIIPQDDISLEDSDTSLFRYSNQFKEFITDKYDCDLQDIYSKSVDEIVEMDVVNGVLVDAEEEYQTQAEQQTQQQEVKRDTTPTETIRQSRQSGKTKLTPDEIKRRREAEEFMRKFPEFGAEKDPKYRVDVTQDDSVANYGIEGMAQDSVDDRSPALRTSAMVEPPKIDQDQLQKMREKFKK